MERLTGFARKLPLLDRSATARQFVKFVVVGFTNTFWDYALYVVLTRGWLGFELHFLYAQFLAFVGSVINSYVLNRRWTFRNTDRRYRIQLGKFFLVNCVTVALYEILLYIFIDRLGVYDLLAKAIVIVPVTLWNFSANKLWTFRAQRERQLIDRAPFDNAHGEKQAAEGLPKSP